MDMAARRIIAKSQELTDGGKPFIIAIDGRCASGKTTLASRLEELMGWSVFHMDDFFLQADRRAKTWTDMAGGNMDYGRFLEEVLVPIKNGREYISYRPFDCRSQSYREPIYVKTGDICLVEGSYSCHPQLWDYYNLRVFLTISPEEQKRRIIQREGTDAAHMFMEQWIPLEEKYFSVFGIDKRCDMCFGTSQ